MVMRRIHGLKVLGHASAYKYFGAYRARTPITNRMEIQYPIKMVATNSDPVKNRNELCAECFATGTGHGMRNGNWECCGPRKSDKCTSGHGTRTCKMRCLAMP